jgi:hypothetical protein
MPVSSFIRTAAPWRQLALGGLGALGVAACSLPHATPEQAPVPAVATAPAPSAPAPVPAPVAEPAPQAHFDPADSADQAARRLLFYHERLRQMAPSDVAAEIARLGAEVSPTDSTASPDAVLDLALALEQQHNPGDLARAASLLESITQAIKPELRAWQPMANLLAAHIAEQRRLEDQLERQAAQRRDTQRAIQQLSEKLEALKAIERSMTSRPPGTAASGTEPAPPATKTP